MKKVLIVEDDKFLSNAYRLKLTKAGFEIMAARDGNEAIEILKTFIPDIILLDLVMPVKDGFTTLSEIKADDKLKNIPVIIASNLGQKEDIDKAMSLGGSDYVVKSNLSLDDLVNKINKILNV